MSVTTPNRYCSEYHISFSVTNLPLRFRHRYISAVAKYYLHDRIQIQAGAFFRLVILDNDEAGFRQLLDLFRGLNQVIPPNRLSVFCAPELQVRRDSRLSLLP